MHDKQYYLGIDIGSTTVKIAICDENDDLLFSDYKRYFADIQNTLQSLLASARSKLGRPRARCSPTRRKWRSDAR